MKNSNRELRFVKLNTVSLKLIVFIDVFFVNNINFILQIDYVICLTNAANKTNLFHWSSTKCKRVTRNVLISKLFAMIQNFDVESILKSIVEKILQIFFFMIICIDFKSLYDCLVRLGSTHEKRLMIDIMCLKKFYERKKITKIKWIDEKNNSVDVMIKSNLCSTLRIFINTNRINLQIIDWIERESEKKWGLKNEISEIWKNDYFIWKMKDQITHVTHAQFGTISRTLIGRFLSMA